MYCKWNLFIVFSRFFNIHVPTSRFTRLHEHATILCSSHQAIKVTYPRVFVVRPTRDCFDSHLTVICFLWPQCSTRYIAHRQQGCMNCHLWKIMIAKMYVCIYFSSTVHPYRRRKVEQLFVNCSLIYYTTMIATVLHLAFNKQSIYK